MSKLRIPALIVTIVAAAIVLPASAAASTVAFHADVQATTQSPAGWNEPSAITGADGRLYMSAQNPELSGAPGSPDVTIADSTNGVNWLEDTGYYGYMSTKNDGTVGDVTMTADRAGTVFVGHINLSLQADIEYSRDDGQTWQSANAVAQLQAPTGASNSPQLVDRPWIAAYSRDTNYRDTTIYMEYHDFTTSTVYIVTCSMATGSLVCGAPVPVSNPQTACNSIPGGLAVSPPGSAHPGRVFAVWTTADPQTNVASGCNYTQLAPFYALYVSWSDTPSVPGSWHQAPVYVGPTGASQDCPGTAPVNGVSTNTCADMSEVFTPIAVDQAGNAYVAFVDYISTLDKHYDVWLERSTDAGNTWDGSKTGAGKPILVSNPGGTHFTPNLTAGSSGHVAVVYYATSYADTPYVNGDTCPTTVPPETSCQGKAQPEPPSTTWVTDVSESLNATASKPSFTQYQASDPGVVVHYGDICNLGIYCDGSSTGNRSLFENNTLFPDRNGYLVAAWGDQRLDPSGQADAAQSNAQSLQEAHDEIFATCQVSGSSLFAHPAAGTTCGK
jgi:hypothetical protein